MTELRSTVLEVLRSQIAETSRILSDFSELHKKMTATKKELAVQKREMKRVSTIKKLCEKMGVEYVHKIVKGLIEDNPSDRESNPQQIPESPPQVQIAELEIPDICLDSNTQTKVVFASPRAVIKPVLCPVIFESQALALPALALPALAPPALALPALTLSAFAPLIFGSKQPLLCLPPPQPVWRTISVEIKTFSMVKKDVCAMMFEEFPVLGPQEEVIRSLTREEIDDKIRAHNQERRENKAWEIENSILSSAEPLYTKHFAGMNDDSNVFSVITYIHENPFDEAAYNLTIEDGTGTPHLNITSSFGTDNHYEVVGKLYSWDIDPNAQTETRDSSNTVMYVRGFIAVYSAPSALASINRKNEKLIARIYARFDQQKRKRGGGTLDPNKQIVPYENDEWFVPGSGMCLADCLTYLGCNNAETILASKVNSFNRGTNAYARISLASVPIVFIKEFPEEIKFLSHRKDKGGDRYIIKYYKALTKSEEKKNKTRELVSRPLSIDDTDFLVYIESERHFVIRKRIISPIEARPDIAYMPKYSIPDKIYTKKSVRMNNDPKAKYSSEIGYYDLETFPMPELNRQQYCYAAGYVLRSDIPEDEKTARLEAKNITKVFISEDLEKEAYIDMLVEIVERAGANGIESVKLFAHNGSGFDARIIVRDVYALKKAGFEIANLVSSKGKILLVGLSSSKTFEKEGKKYGKSKDSKTLLCNETEEQYIERHAALIAQKKKTRVNIALKRWVKEKFVDSGLCVPKPQIVIFSPKIVLQCSIRTHIGFSISLKNFELSLGLTPYEEGGLLKRDFDICAITRDNYIDLKDDWLEYFYVDIVGLGFACKKLSSSLLDTLSLSPESYITQAATAVEYHKNLKKGGAEQAIILDVFASQLFQECMTGGRVISNVKFFEDIISREEAKEIAVALEEKHEDCMLSTLTIPDSVKTKITQALENKSYLIDEDATSLYPSAMYLESVGDFPLRFPGPISDEIYCIKNTPEHDDLINSDPIAFCEKYVAIGEFSFDSVQGREDLTFPLFSVKTKDSRVWGKGGCDSIFSNSQEIGWAASRQYITNIRIKNALVFKAIISPFKDTVEKLFELRVANKSSKSLYFGLKVLVNSLFGVQAKSTPEDTTYFIEDNSMKKNAMRLKQGKPPIEKPTSPDDFSQKYAKIMKIDSDRVKEIRVLTPPEDWEIDPVVTVKVSNPNKYVMSAPKQHGIITLANSKIIMNQYIHEINGFLEPKIHYSDTDSIFIPRLDLEAINACAQRMTGSDVAFGDMMGGIKNDLGANAGVIFMCSSGQKQKYVFTASPKDGDIKISIKKTYKGCAKSSLPSTVEYIDHCNGGHLAVPLEKYSSFPVAYKLCDEPRIHTSQTSYLNWEKKQTINLSKKLKSGQRIALPENCRFYEYSWDYKQQGEFSPFRLQEVRDKTRKTPKKPEAPEPPQGAPKSLP